MITKNKKATFNLTIKETIEAGICLVGCEVKSIRNGHITIHESFIRIINNDVYLMNANILPYAQGNRENPPQNRNRKLLLHRKQITKLMNRLNEKGCKLFQQNYTLNSSELKLRLALANQKTV